MARKVTDGPLRNKERTKDKLIAAVGKILKKDSFSGLSITKVAAVAKVDRRLIYDYFGGLDSLVRAYLEEKDYWKISNDEVDNIAKMNIADAGKTLAYNILEHQFESLLNNEEMCRIINWGLSEKLEVLKELDLKRETVGDELFSGITDDHFKNTDKNFRAIFALLMGGVYYLSLHAKMQENPFCGINVQQPSGKEEIKKAIRQLLDQVYS